MTLPLKKPEQWFQCPKCLKYSGDAWVFCNGACPVEDSPYYSEEAFKNYGPLLVVDYHD